MLRIYYCSKAFFNYIRVCNFSKIKEINSIFIAKYFYKNIHLNIFNGAFLLCRFMYPDLLKEIPLNIKCLGVSYALLVYILRHVYTYSTELPLQNMRKLMRRRLQVQWRGEQCFVAFLVLGLLRLSMGWCWCVQHLILQFMSVSRN